MTSGDRISARRQRRRVEPSTEWINGVRTSAFRIGRARGLSKAEADDVAQQIAVGAWCRVDVLMTKYADPATYAGARFSNGLVDWPRRQSTQKGEGARRTRRALSLDAPAPGSVGSGPTWADRLGDDGAAVEAAERTVLSEQVRTVVGSTLDQRSATAVLAIKGAGVPVSEYASSVGMARETTSRMVSRAVRQLEPALRPLLDAT
jgi:RNA polymerase sigma factor (sigma-70 family)